MAKKPVATKKTRKPRVARESPFGRPYQLEALVSPADVIKEMRRFLKLRLRDDESGVGCIREGSNAYGTWGYLYTWDGSDWIHQGYTLEPRPDVGKGPIPIGDYNFNRWMSSHLGKTLRLHNVPGFTDILIHVGNTQDETRGCILAARSVDTTNNPTRLVNSRVLTDWLYDTHSEGVVFVISR